WDLADEIALIDYIADHKSEAGDGMKFKQAFWNSAAVLMKVHSATGGPKTAAGCSAKWDRLKKSYNVVAALKRLSGFSWDDENGLNIDIKQIFAWNECKNKDAKPFKTKGFPHFNRIQAIMPSTVRG
ncbi:hypothetical protein BYT27DRAFT_7005294, partial [Phlegmacium glaucopus]